MRQHRYPVVLHLKDALLNKRFFPVFNKKLINIFIAVHLILLLAIGTLQAAIEVGTPIKTYSYDVRKDTKKDTWFWGIINAHINHRCPYNLSDASLSTRGPNSDNPTACLWDVIPTSELSRPNIPKNMLCKKVFEQYSLPADSTRHLVAFTNSKLKKLQEQSLIVDGQIQSVEGVFWGGGVGTNHGSVSVDVAGITFYSAKGYKDSSLITFLPFNYGAAPKRFVIGRIFSNIEEITNFSPGGVDEQMAKFCITKSEEYGNGVVAEVTWLGADNKPLKKAQFDQQSLICLYSNTYAGNNDNKKMLAMNDSIKGRDISFWSESTLPDLTQSEIDGIGLCKIDSDGDGIPDHADPCPYRKPDIFNDSSFRSRFNMSTTTREERWQMALAHEPDSDGDGVGDNCDNCRNVSNPDQKNTSGNPKGFGDACNPAMLTKPVNSTDLSIQSSCDKNNYMKNSLCDIVTDQEKAELNPLPFITQGVEISLPPFNFTINSNKNNRNCKLGKITYGSKLIVDCKNIASTDSKYYFCETGCEIINGCYYKAKFNIEPAILKNEIGILDYFDNATKNLRLNFEVFIDSDYVSNKVGSFKDNVDSGTFKTTSSTSSTDTHRCLFDVDVSKELAEIKSVKCDIKIGDAAAVINVNDANDYVHIINNAFNSCK